MEEALRELFETAEPLPDDADLFDVENQLALLNLLAAATPDERPVYLSLRGFPDGASDSAARTVAELFQLGWSEGMGVELEPVRLEGPANSDCAIRLKGLHARQLAKTEVGTHLVLPKHGGPIPVRVDVVDEWPPRLPDAHAFGPIVRVYPENQPVIDVRTGLVSNAPHNPEVLRTFTLAALPRAT